jgi:hypothetical protein
MTDELAALVERLRVRAAAVTSFTAEFTSTYSINLVPFNAKGTMWYKRPGRFRSEQDMRGSTIVSVRNGVVVERYTEGRPLVWRYNLALLPQTEPMNFPLADPADPFLSVDAESLQPAEAPDNQTLCFTARGLPAGRGGSLDTRLGFTIGYTPKVPDIQVTLGIDALTGLLVSLCGRGNDGREVFRHERRFTAVNAALEDSLFEIARRSPGSRTIDLEEILAASLDPDAADGPPSTN